MTERSGGAPRRGTAFVTAILLCATALPGANTMPAPVDPALASDGYALIRVGHSTARAVAAQVRSLGADDVSELDAIDMVTARVSSATVRVLSRDPRVVYIAADTVVTA